MEKPSDDDRRDYEDLTGPFGPDAPLNQPPPKSKRASNILAMLVGILIPLAFFALVVSPSVCSLRDAAHKSRSMNSLKQIGIGIHNYNDTFDELPENTYAPDDTPLLSWRVHLLPFIEEEKLYNLFRLDEPWDSPNNLPLLQRMPAVYAHPQRQTQNRGVLTHYRGFSSPGAVFERRPGVPAWQCLFVGPAGLLPRPMPLRPAFRLASFKDGMSNTILVVEAAQGVEWTKPDDLDASVNCPMPKLGGLWRGDRFNALFGDGSARFLKSEMPEDTLRALITHSGGESLPPNITTVRLTLYVFDATYAATII